MSMSVCPSVVTVNKVPRQPGRRRQHGSGPFTNADLTALHVRRAMRRASQTSRASPLTWLPNQGANAAEATPAPKKTHCIRHIRQHDLQWDLQANSKLWTGRPYDKPSWYLLNRRSLFDTFNSARQFVRYGISVDKKVSVTEPSARTGVPQRHDHRRHPRRANSRSIRCPALTEVEEQTAPVTNTTSAPALPAAPSDAPPAQPPQRRGQPPLRLLRLQSRQSRRSWSCPRRSRRQLGAGYERLQIAPALVAPAAGSTTPTKLQPPMAHAV